MENTLNNMTERDTIEIFTENLKKAASICRDLSKVQTHKHHWWLKIDQGLQQMARTSGNMYAGRALSRTDVLKVTENWATHIGVRDKLNG